jgi:flagellar M-ring protein FliF
MDLLNRAYAQLYERFRVMPPGSRLTAGLCALVALASLGYLVTHQASSPDVDLMRGVAVSASQLQKMDAALAEANLSGYEVRGTSIFVPRGQESNYMGALAKAKALPPTLGTGLQEAANSGSWLDIGAQRDRERMKIAKTEELRKAICNMSGIESASVLCDEYNPGGFKEKVVTVVALVKPVGAGQLDEAAVTAIRNMMPDAFAGLKLENVTVADLNGRTWRGNPEEADAAGDKLYLSLKRIYEQDLKAKILSSLHFIPNVTVEPSVVLDRQHIAQAKQDNRARGVERRDGGDAAKARDVDNRSDRSQGVFQQSNTAAIINSLLGAPRGKEETPVTAASDREPRGQAERDGIGLAPISARVSVGVPVSYLKKVWQERNPSVPGMAIQTPDPAALEQIRIEESAKIQRHVAPLLPTTGSAASAADMVVVTLFQDPEIPAPETPLSQFQQAALKWLGQSWSTLGMIGLALVSLLVLRSMVRSTPTTATQPAKAQRAAMDEDAPNSEPAKPRRGQRRQRFDAASPSFREELSAIVEDDPETAANVLRNWIGQGV